MGFGGFPFSQSHNFDATNPCPEMFSSMSLQRDVWRILHVCLIYVDLFFIFVLLEEQQCFIHLIHRIRAYCKNPPYISWKYAGVLTP